MRDGRRVRRRRENRREGGKERKVRVRKLREERRTRRKRMTNRLVFLDASLLHQLFLKGEDVKRVPMSVFKVHGATVKHVTHAPCPPRRATWVRPSGGVAVGVALIVCPVIKSFR